jgi:hypothetical protein
LPFGPSTRYRLRLRLADRVIALPTPGTLVIGRGADCDVALSDPSVSRKHARVEADAEGRVLVHDLGSVHGVLVNGARVRGSAPLTHGSRLGILSCTLVLVDASVRRSATTRPADSGPLGGAPSPTAQLGAKAHAMSLGSALEAGDRVLAEEIATRAVTGLTRGGLDTATLRLLEGSLAKLGETDAYWLDKLLELHFAHRSLPDAAIVTRMHVLARAGHGCTPEILQRYLDVIGKRTDLPTGDQVLYRRLLSLSRAPNDG